VHIAAYRLAGSSLNYEGRLEVYHNGEWGTVCEQEGRITANEAKVACYALGFGYGVS